MPHTAVFFHAHPDDEAMLTAGTMAKAAAAGDRVVVVFATRGEVGEAAAELTDDGGLGARRTAEALAAAEALGVHRVEFLDYLDSGSTPDPVGGWVPGSFCAAPVDEAAARLAAILRDEHAEMLTSYDPLGGYGHPDHIQVHAVAAAAAAVAGTPTVLEATISRGLLQMAIDLLPTLGYELPTDFVPPDLATVYASDDEITHRVDVTAHLAEKRAAMAAHTSQTTTSAEIDPGTTARTLALFLQIPDDLFGLAFGTEFYVDRSAPDGTVATELFADHTVAAGD